MMRRPPNLRFPNIVDMSRRVKEKWAVRAPPAKSTFSCDERADDPGSRDDLSCDKSVPRLTTMSILHSQQRHANAGMQLFVASRQHSLAARG